MQISSFIFEFSDFLIVIDLFIEQSFVCSFKVLKFSYLKLVFLLIFDDETTQFFDVLLLV